MQRLKKRADFLAVAKGARVGRRAFSLQSADLGREPSEIGFTVTKKSGNSPQRNRIRRRLREAVRQAESAADAGIAYVVIGRPEALTQRFGGLVTDLQSAMRQIAGKRAPSPLSPNSGSG